MNTTRTLFVLTAALVFSAGAESLSVRTPTLVSTMLSNRNYCPVLEGVGAKGRFGILLQTKIWYHGRTGNTQRFYRDQDEWTWPTVSHTASESSVVVQTGTVDYDVRREIAVETADPTVLRLDYLLTTKETRFYDPIDFPLLYFSKEVSAVSFDDGALASFRTAEKPTQAELLTARAFLLHFPAHDRTLLMLVDVNRPRELGHAQGLSVRSSVNGWSRVFNFHPLDYAEFPFFAQGARLGVRLWFKLLPGGTFNAAQATAARTLSATLGLADNRATAHDADAIYRQPSALAAALPSIEGFGLWAETPMKRVYPDTAAPQAQATQVMLESAANERESFQLVLRPTRTTQLDTVRFSDFVSEKGDKIGASQGFVHRLGYERVADASALLAQETRFADRLIPVTGATALSADENTILHLTVFTPPGTPAGLYRGSVTLQLAEITVVVPVALKVWNVELPKESAYIGHMLIWNSPVARREEVLARFGECGLMGTVYTGAGAPKLKACFDGTELRLPDDFALAEKSVKQLGAPYFHIPWAFMGAWNWNTNKTVFLGLNLKIDSPAFDLNFRNYLTSAYRQLAARGLAERSFLYMWDEMTEGHYPAMRKTTEMVRRYAPGVKILTVSAPDPEVLAQNDIVVAGHPAHWWNSAARDIVRQANASGKRIWMYANSVTFGTASRSLVPRLTPWLCRSHGMSGYLHWSCDYNWKANDFAKNGNEWLLYPSDGEPVYSVRMEYFRDGVEDFNLLQMTRRLPNKVRVELARQIATISTDHSALCMRPEQVAAVRRLVAEALSRK